jgi:tetratricopeptide (TPR) repeat protein
MMDIQFYGLVLLLFSARSGEALGAQVQPASSSAVAKKPAVKPAPAVSPAEFERLKSEARALFQSEKIADALKVYGQLVTLQPACSECWWYLGTLSYDQEKFSEAAAAFSKFVVLEPKNGPAWGFLGLSEYKMKRYGLALTYLEKARNLGLGDNEELKSAVRFHHAVLLNRTGNFEAARFILIRSFAVPDHESELVLLALGMADLHIPLLPDELRGEQREMALQFGKAVFLGYSGRVPQAEELFEKLLEKYRGQPNVAYAYGVALSEGQRHDEALKYFRQELERDPKHLSAMLQVGWILVLKGQYAEAKSYVEKGLAKDPENFAAVYLNGRILLAEKQYKLAITALEKAVSLDPDSPNAYFSLMQAYKRDNRMADAVRAQKRFEELNELQAKQLQAPATLDQRNPADNERSPVK